VKFRVWDLIFCNALTLKQTSACRKDVKSPPRVRIPYLALPGSLDHELSNQLLDPSLATFRAFYFALFVLAYGHYEGEDLVAVKALILICRHSHLPARVHHGQSILRLTQKLLNKDYSEP